MRFSSWAKPCGIALIFFCSFDSATAVDYTWQGGNHNWTANGNRWSVNPNVRPDDSSDTATVTSDGVTITLNDSFAIGALNFGGTGNSLTGTGGSLSIGTLTGANSITITGGVTVTGTHNVTNGSTQTITSLNYGAGSTFAWDLSTVTTDPGNGASNQGTYDKVSTTTLTGAAGTQTFQILLAGSSFTNAFWDTNKSWTNIFTSTTGTLGSIFDTFSGAGVASSGLVANQGQFSFSGNTLSWSAIPEPSSALAGLLLCAGIVRRRRD